MKSARLASAWEAVRTPFGGFGTLLRALLRGTIIIGYLALRLVLVGVVTAWQALTRPPTIAGPTPSGDDTQGGVKERDSADARQDLFVSAVMAFVVGAGVILGGLGAAIAVLAPRLAPYGTLIAYGLLAVWLISAGIVGSRAPLPWGTPASRNDHEKSAGEETREAKSSEDPADVQARAERDLCIVILQAVHDAHKKKRKGIHIADLLDQLREDYTGFDDWDVTRLRKWCDGAGLPTNRNVKVNGSNPTWGIRYDELTTTLRMPIPEAIAALRNTPLPRPAEEVREEADERTLTTPAASPDTTTDEAVPTTLLARHLGAVSTPSSERVV
ncbi:hypothetical protein [Streptomyces cinereoruber]